MVVRNYGEATRKRMVSLPVIHNAFTQRGDRFDMLPRMDGRRCELIFSYFVGMVFVYMEIVYPVISVSFVVKIPGKRLVVIFRFVRMVDFATATTLEPALLEPLSMAEHFLTQLKFLSHTQIRRGLRVPWNLGTIFWSN